MIVMKILTLNCHSLEEENYQDKLLEFAQWTAKEKPDIVALQEVNQSIEAKAVSSETAEGFTSDEKDLILKSDNHAYNLAKLLSELGYPMYWTWTPAKIGYGKYQEGLAIFSSMPFKKTVQCYTTHSKEFENWKVRKALSVVCDVNGKEMQFVTVHMGWWEDKEEPFTDQWESLEKIVEKNMKCFVMGDFNSPASVSGGGYDYITAKGWKDTYNLAEIKDEGYTVCKKIDGWKDKDTDGKMRIDFIFTNENTNVEKSVVVFNGTNGGVVSDHYGVMITLK